MVTTDTGQLYVWGWNKYGQAGSPTVSNVKSPRIMPGVGGVISAAGGQAYTVVLAAG